MLKSKTHKSISVQKKKSSVMYACCGALENQSHAVMGFELIIYIVEPSLFSLYECIVWAVI